MTVDQPALAALFAAGPQGFVGAPLRRFLELTQPSALAPPTPVTPPNPPPKAEQPADAPQLVDAPAGPDAWQAEATKRVRRLWTGSPADVLGVWGTPAAPELATFFELTSGANVYSTFTELRLDAGLLADADLPPGENLFELCVLADQLNYLGTALPEAFSGSLCFANYGDGDSWHFDVYQHADEPRAITRYAHDEHAFVHQPVAFSLHDAVFLAALVKAFREEWLTAEQARAGLATLSGKVAPSWHFSLEDLTEDFTPLKTKAASTAARLSVRAAWISKVLGGDHVTGLEELPSYFHVSLNEALSGDALARRMKAAATIAPTAVYSMWRAYLFDEPQLEESLRLGRAHPGRLARDCATLIDELRSGRKTLGKIQDWPARLAKARSFDLDPRNADAKAARQKRAEEEALARRAELVRQLEAVADDQLAAFIAQHGSAGLWPELLARVRSVLEPRSQRALDGLVAGVHSYDNSTYSEEEHELVDELATSRHPALEAYALATFLHGTRDTRPRPHVGRLLLERWAERGALTVETGRALWAEVDEHALEQENRLEARRVLELLATQAWPALSEVAGERLSRVLSLLPTDGGFDTSLHFDELNAVVARVAAKLGTPSSALVTGLTALAKTPALRLRKTRVHGALALATLDPTLGGEAEVILEGLLAHVAKINDGEEAALALLTFVRAALRFDEATKKRWATRVLETEPYAASQLETRAARAAALRALGAPADVEATFDALCTTPGWKPEYTVRQHALALELLPLTGHEPSDTAVEALATSDHEPARRWATPVAKTRGLEVHFPRRLSWVDGCDATPEQLRRLLGDETLVGRHHAARALVPPGSEANDDETRRALEQAVDAAAARVTGPKVPHDDERLLTEGVRALLRLPAAPSTHALFNRLLLHPHREVKDPVLRQPPDDLVLEPGMRQVVAEKWGWQESTAKAWLEARGLTP